MNQIFMIIATDMGDTCDGQARILGVSNYITTAKKIMNDDISYYLENNGRKEDEVERDSETFVIVGDEGDGCKWQILETKFTENAGV